MDWKNYIESFAKDVHFAEPATNENIDGITKHLNIELPSKLLDLLKQTNGIFDNYKCPFIWPTSRIIEDNLYFRNFEGFKDIYMPFDQLLFFSDSGTGDLFGYAILNGQIQTDDIFVWDHETVSRKWIAPSLEAFLKGWITGDIST
ncbi:SMI1/KNR4 family protein [Solibacillus sp. CAU 1738]|uniref:SMI1/KNR4 family protein n=1 Tax=Solibacillus sp. CAU 1738 TaxID=3140363 RepID=UPI0032611B20